MKTAHEAGERTTISDTEAEESGEMVTIVTVSGRHMMGYVVDGGAYVSMGAASGLYGLAADHPEGLGQVFWDHGQRYRDDVSRVMA